jgi:hypothetical protein
VDLEEFPKVLQEFLKFLRILADFADPPGDLADLLANFARSKGQITRKTEKLLPGACLTFV